MTRPWSIYTFSAYVDVALRDVAIRQIYRASSPPPSRTRWRWETFRWWGRPGRSGAVLLYLRSRIDQHAAMFVTPARTRTGVRAMRWNEIMRVLRGGKVGGDVDRFCRVLSKHGHAIMPMREWR